MIYRLQTNKQTGNFLITVPRRLVEAKGWKKGDTMQFSLNRKGDLVIKRLDQEKIM
tara:strand:- start:4130 stop:4297 length:168 start_codon:yes stop_codon:yes gene_type:complete